MGDTSAEFDGSPPHKEIARPDAFRAAGRKGSEMTTTTVTDLTINGVSMPDPALEGVTISTEKVWSSNTGRTASGRMVGSVIAKKTTIKIKWPVLTPAQAAVIESAVSDSANPFVPVAYTDMCGQRVTRTVYFGTPSYTVYSWADGLQLVKDVSVSGIEQ